MSYKVSVVIEKMRMATMHIVQSLKGVKHKAIL